MKSMHGALAFPQRTNSQLPNIRPVYMVSSLSIRIFDLEVFASAHVLYKT